MCAEITVKVHLKQKVQLLQDPEDTFFLKFASCAQKTLSQPLSYHIFKVLFYISILLLAVLGFHCRA